MSPVEQEILEKVPEEGIPLGDLLDQLSDRAKSLLLATKRKGIVKFSTVAGEETRVLKGGKA